MNGKLLPIFLSAIAIATASVIPTTQTAQAGSRVRFVCGQSYDQTSGQRYPTTYAWNTRGKMPIIRWKKQWNGSITPQQRCEAVSSRFQEAYERGTLKFLTNGTMNGQPVICTTRRSGSACDSLLVTLQRGEDSTTILNELKEVLGGRATEAITRSPDANAQPYYQIDIEKFLETATVEEEGTAD